MSGSVRRHAQKPRVIVGISGASGFSYGVQALRYLRQLDVESHLVISPAGHLNREHETTLTENDVAALADVVLKERRRLVMMVRETPLHAGHLRNMLQVTESGGIVFPPVPALYAKPASVEEIITHSVARALSLLDLDCADLPRWGENMTLMSRSKDA